MSGSEADYGSDHHLVTVTLKLMPRRKIWQGNTAAVWLKKAKRNLAQRIPPLSNWTTSFKHWQMLKNIHRLAQATPRRTPQGRTRVCSLSYSATFAEIWEEKQLLTTERLVSLRRFRRKELWATVTTGGVALLSVPSKFSKRTRMHGPDLHYAQHHRTVHWMAEAVVHQLRRFEKAFDSIHRRKSMVHTKRIWNSTTHRQEHLQQLQVRSGKQRIQLQCEDRC